MENKILEVLLNVQDKLTTLANDVKVIKDDVGTLKSDVSILSKRVEVLENRFDNLEDKVDKLDFKIEDGFKTLELMNNNNNTQINKVEAKLIRFEKVIYKNKN